MSDLDDELESLRFHRHLKPDVYYRCPSTESLDGAIRNETEKNATSLIPVDIVTEFVFGIASTITVPITQQRKLEALFQPADYPQSITVEHALCRSIEGKERLTIQRAIARSFIETIQEVDGFRYIERQAWNKEGSDGVRFKYVCADSLQNRDRKSNAKKEKDGKKANEEKASRPKSAQQIPTYDCGGAIHIKFSTKRDAINVVYKHNLIHRDVENRPANGITLPSALEPADGSALQEATNGTSDSIKKRKGKSTNKHKLGNESALDNSGLIMPEPYKAINAPASKKRMKGADSPEASRASSKKKVKKTTEQPSSSKSHKKATTRELSPSPLQPVKGKCLRCREKGIKCNEVKPSCNQCSRGLWTCQYDSPGQKKRSKNGCMNCRSRKRKCTEERPSCAHCLKVDDDCTYRDYA